MPQRVRFSAPYKDIVVDVDGTLTSPDTNTITQTAAITNPAVGSPLSTVVRYGKHMDPTECTATVAQLALFDGVICAPTT